MAHVVIVGGGLIGLLTGRALRAHGFDVTVLERGACGREASWAGGGILSPLHPWRFPDAVTALAGRSQTLWPALARALSAETGIDPEYRPTGMLVTGADEAAEVRAWCACHGLRIESITATEMAQMVPGLVVSGDGGWWLPTIASVRNPRALRALAASAAADGIRLREGVEVTTIARAEDRVVGAETTAGRIPADAVVVCAGAWSARLLAGLGAEPPAIRPVRGQMLALAAPGRLDRIVLADDHYLIPRVDGTILVGSTLEEAGFDAVTTPAAATQLRAAAARLLPPLADVPQMAHWAGLRPASPDGVPTIARHPRIDGLWLNAGHFRNGIVSAPASAELAAAMVAGTVPVLDPAPYAWPPER